MPRWTPAPWAMAITASASFSCFSAVAFAEDEPGTFRIPETTTTLTFSGYAQLDVAYDFKARNPYVEADDYAIIAARIPLSSSYEARKKSGQLYLTARTSRLGLTTLTTTRWVDIGARLEADFWSGNLLTSQEFTNSVLARLRHAYGTLSGKYGTLLVGQTWSTFMDLNAAAQTVDFNGPGSGPGLRMPMIRYTIPLQENFTVALAAENAAGTDQNGITDGPGTKTPYTRKVQRIPDLVGRVETAGTWGSVSAAGVTTHYEDVGAPGGDSYSKQGWGASLSTALNVFGDTFRASVTGGRGLGRYMFAAGSAQGVTDTGERFVLWDALGYHVNYTHVWNPQFRSNVVWSQTFFRNNGASSPEHPYEPTFSPETMDIVDPEVNQQLEELYVNTFWTLTRQVEFGLEYTFGRRHTFGNDEARGPCVPGILCAAEVGTMHRVTSTARFNLF
ncbi:DcaP family trimeric outer membrane transporter [Pendulispora rubella]|uniref:DcaP family trimeric outer membrane transporter n=1 Tax=Pendulispora rubella TaxID=2741070 RepID=A0ABZ2LAK0_9BACT